MDNTSIGDRFKRHELTTKAYLTPRMPTIIRLDGKAFHTWTKKHLEPGPFNLSMYRWMKGTTDYLFKNIQNSVFAYSQSDEISILLNDWKKLNSEQWYGGSIQKIASVSASMATAAFNAAFIEDTMGVEIENFALFDSRVFQVPKEEVVNYFIWRQQDATRNSINMLAQSHFSHKKLQGLSTNEVQELLWKEAQTNWDTIDTWKKRGFAIYNDELDNRAIIWDNNIPIFTQDRYFIEKHLETEQK